MASDGVSRLTRSGGALRGKLRQLKAEARLLREGHSSTDRLRIARMLVHCHTREGRARAVFRHLPSARPLARQVRLRSGIVLLGRPGDGTVLFEHFGLDVYGIPVPDPVHTVVDLGANVGYATLRLAQRFPGARFVCVEPASPERVLLEANAAYNGIDADIFGVAVTATPGSFALEPASHAGATRVRAVPAGAVEGVTLATLFDRAQIQVVDLLKVDIEGSERALFESPQEWAPRVRTLIAELHDGLSGATLERTLGPLGFRRISIRPGLGLDDLVCFTRGRAGLASSTLE